MRLYYELIIIMQTCSEKSAGKSCLERDWNLRPGTLQPILFSTWVAGSKRLILSG